DRLQRFLPRRHGLDRLALTLDDPCRLAVGADPEGVRIVQLQQRGDAREHARDLGVGHDPSPIRFRNSASSITAMPSFFASSSLDPAPGPATTSVTLRVIAGEIRAPAA